jgi:hypothetical protein
MFCVTGLVDKTPARSHCVNVKFGVVARTAQEAIDHVMKANPGFRLDSVNRVGEVHYISDVPEFR